MKIPKRLIPLISKLFLILIFSFETSSALLQAQTTHQGIRQTTIQEELVNAEKNNHPEDPSSDHSSDMSPLFFLIIALIIGAGTRHFLKKSPLPYTVSLLVIGLLLGAFARLGYFGEWNLYLFHLNTDFLGKAVGWAGHIDPHLILYVFLPTLIFEAAFAMDVHTFKKSFTNAFILAVPGIIVALLLTALIVMTIQFLGIGMSEWTWLIALLFGTVISAT
ncbi:MAG: cation:proton antiporter, partial [Bacteroidales bacterium]